MKILVVCGGNTCRSPAAEAAIRDRSRRAGLDLTVSSAGASAGFAGSPPTATMVEVARERGLELEGAAHQIEPADLEDVDLVLVMDTMTRMFVESLAPVESFRVELLGSYDESEANNEIADPYGGDREVYAATLERIIASVDGLIRSLTD